MADFTYPASDLDRPDRLLAILGSFWDSTYQGNPLAASLANAVASRINQVVNDQQELLDAVSRFKIRVWHTENWLPLTLLQSQENGGNFALLTFNGDVNFQASTPYRFGVPLATPYYAWPLPPGLVDLPVITNRITATSLTLIYGVDYWLQDGYLLFAGDPFANPLAARQAIITDNTVTDQQMTLWGFKARLDRGSIYNQFGYALGLDLPGTETYKQTVNAMLNSVTGGTTGTDIRLAWSAITGAAVIQHATETVDRIISESDRIMVVTDLAVYPLDPSAVVTVSPGQSLWRGDSVSDALTFIELNRGQVPDPSILPSVGLGNGMLDGNFTGALIFENKNVPLVVTADSEGRTRIDFELGGFPGNVELFFDNMHARGVAAGNTLAELMDQRPAGARDTQPTAGALPAFINPLQFLIQNVLRNNFFMVKVRISSAFVTGDMNSAKLFRKIIPPGTGMIVIIELVADRDQIIMDGPGTDTTAGYTEDVSIYLGMAMRETMDPSDYITERVKLKQLSGYCA